MHQILKITNRLKLFFVVLQIEVDGEKIALSKTYFWDFETKSCKVNEIKVSSVEKKDVEIATPNFESGVCTENQSDKKCNGKAKTNYNVDRKNRGVDDIACVRPMNSLEQFVQETLLNSTFCNTTIIGHGRKFLSLVYKALLKLNSQPVPIRKSSGLLRLVPTTNNIRFTTIDTYLSKG